MKLSISSLVSSSWSHNCFIKHRCLPAPFHSNFIDHGRKKDIKWMLSEWNVGEFQVIAICNLSMGQNVSELARMHMWGGLRMTY